jgi:hypothetical protein
MKVEIGLYNYYMVRKLIGFVFMMHAVVSVIKYRKHLIFSESAIEFSIPIDVLIPIMVRS